MIQFSLYILSLLFDLTLILTFIFDLMCRLILYFGFSSIGDRTLILILNLTLILIL